MAIVTLRLLLVRSSVENHPDQFVYCRSPLLQRLGGWLRAIKDTHVYHALIYLYRYCQCKRTIRHYPNGITSARQITRLDLFAALCWVLGLSLRCTNPILSAFPVSLSHMSVWRDVQVQAAALKRWLPCQVRVLGVDGFYPNCTARSNRPWCA